MDNDKYIGRLLDNRYEIQEILGVGGMAVVYKARCHRLNRLVAIKILKDEYSKDEEFRRRFHAEGQAVAMLSHPNIVSVYDVSTTEEADYIVMELIDGISLKQYMEKKGVLNWKETLHFAIQISKALEHAHSRGIVHRDIKPHNVMVLKNGSVKVADFGIARVMSKSNTLTKEALGSVHYISPEQAKGGRVDNRSDIYSLGTVMYEMMTGRPPYDGESPVAIAIQHINGGAKMPSTLNPNIPGGLEQIIMKAMAHEPNARYATATAMLYDMDEFRKLPAILFDYNTPPTDEVTKLQPAAEKPKPAVTDAERAAAAAARRRAAGERARRQGTSNGTGRNSASAHRTRKPQPKEEETNKAATAAVIVCSAVAIVAIVIFIITLFNGGILGNKTQIVMVPTFLGREYSTLQNVNGIIISEPDYEYSDIYDKGEVCSQDPQPGEQVEKNTEVKLVVSLGAPPQSKLMENLVGQKLSTAENFLTGQEILFLVEEEHSDEVEVGKIVRTDPAANSPIAEGQKVTLYVSIGPAIEEKEMPDVAQQSLETAKKILEMLDLKLKYEEIEEESSEVVEEYVIRTEPAAGDKLTTGQTVTIYVSTGPKKVKMPDVVGKSADVAQEILKYAGFTVVTATEYVDSEMPKDQVVFQSVEKDTEVSVDTEIVLKLSKGPVPVDVTKTVTFNLLDDMLEPYTLTIKDEAGAVILTQTITDGQPTVDMQLTGSGVKVYEIFINDMYFATQKVDFNAP